ncbi:hypothetical protein EDD21DRAFT_386789 [Dissophora ornata]|nr:hypothetical protein EDD21DRAFT_386789 [Dissophora ornata]
MTGDYSPVATALVDGHWTSQLMIALFFFLTAMLMMNVVIALMNGAYSEAVASSERIWLKNRIDLITGAENLTYFLPNFRNRFDYFPEYIYYTATGKQVKDFEQTCGWDVDGQGKLRFGFNEANVNVDTDQDSLLADAISTANAAVSIQQQLLAENEQLRNQLNLRILQELRCRRHHNAPTP